MKYVQIVLFALASTLFSTNADIAKKGNNNNNKITICHIPPGNPANMHQITISVNALQAHLDHGDIICGSPSR